MDIENYILNLCKNNFLVWNLGLSAPTTIPCREAVLIRVDALKSQLMIIYQRFRTTFDLILFDETRNEVKRDEGIKPDYLIDALYELLYETKDHNKQFCLSYCLN